MIKVNPTTNLIGISIRGDYADFNDLIDSIYRLTSFYDDLHDFHYGVKNRLLGLCYDVRHAYMGDRDVVLEDNGMSREKMRDYGVITSAQNVYYSVNVLFPEAIFVAASVPNMYIYSSRYYGKRATKAADPLQPAFPYSDYIKDQANLDVLCASIWKALGQVIGEEELEKILTLLQRTEEEYFDYATLYIDKCNMELFKATVDKRPDKLKSIAKRIIKKSTSYYNLENDLKCSAKIFNTNIYELEDPSIVYPDEIEW